MMRRIIFSLILVAAPALAEEPEGTSISVQVTDGGETTIEVRNGELKVRAGGEETRVSAGQGVRVRKGEKANKISLLPPPTRLTPGDGEHMNTLDVHLGWSEVSGARSYKLAIASDADFTKPVHESTGAPGVVAPRDTPSPSAQGRAVAPRDTPSPSAQGRAKASVHLPAGTYFWRVRAVDKDGLEGKPSAALKFVIDVTPPKLKAGKPKWR